jgi:CRISPR-associated protein Cas5 subtype I-A
MLLARVLFVPANYFSIKRAEAFQFSPSYLIPPPSTLLGAFARGLFLFKGLIAPKNEEQAKKIVVTTTVRALTPLARTGVILKRLRTLELRERQEKGKSFKPRSDAMVREIVFLPKMEAYYLIDEEEARRVFNENLDLQIKQILYSIDRLGDSESLVSVQSVHTIKVDAQKTDLEVLVNTVLAEKLAEVVSGDYIYTMMPDPIDRKRPMGYYVPLSVIQDRTDVYQPSKFKVKPKPNTLMIKLDEASILFTK